MKIANTCLLLLALSVPSCLLAAEPPREPILRLETGMHTAPIRTIGVDAANRWLATSSDDKTVRVWDLATGELARVLRPPIGAGDEGKIFAVAISRDGNTVACGGWTYDLSVYLFDRSSGQLTRRITGLPAPVAYLTYSPDGRFLVLTVGRVGIRVYRTSDYTEVARDEKYTDAIYYVDFTPDGRLVSVCNDGFVRLYNSMFQLVTYRQMVGARPSGVACSPDGARIAVGFQDSTRIFVFSSLDLSSLYEPNTATADNGSMGRLSFSIDGARLAAGGEFQKNDGTRCIRVWEQAGQGACYDFPAAANTIRDIRPLRDGGFVYGAGDPSWGLIDGRGVQRWHRKGDLADFRNQSEQFRISEDGGTIEFGFDQWGRSPAAFSVSERQFVRGSNTTQPPRTSAEGLDLRGQFTATPTLNGQPLQLDKEERAISAAIAPDNETFLLTCDWSIRLFNRQGKQQWQVAVPSAAWIGNIPGNGRMVVVGLADGTIRWYRMKDGRELLALFPHRDQKRWVLWTPLGYYDCSAGAEELIGWHVNNIGQSELVVVDVTAGSAGEQAGIRTGDVVLKVDGEPVQSADTFRRIIHQTAEGTEKQFTLRRGNTEISCKVTPAPDSVSKMPSIGFRATMRLTQAAESDFFPASRFRNTFYRPDVVAKILETRDEAEALRLVNEAGGRKTQTTSVAQVLPPVITVLSPQDGASVSTEEIEVRYTARASEDAPVTAVRALVDGRPIEGSRGIKVEAAAASQSLKVRVPGRDCEVALVAENRHGASEPGRVRLKWSGQAPEEFVAKPKLYALVVGVSAYADEKLRLKYSAKDARDFAATLERLKGGLYRDVTVKVLTDEKAVKDEVLDGLDWLRKQATSRDVAMVFLSGHGVNDADGSYYYLPANVNVEKLMRTAVRFSDIRETVASIAGKALFFVDTCHAGNVIGGRRAVEDVTRLINELASAENGAVVFASSTGRQYSLENDEWQNGAFTKALIEGLSGKADDKGRGKITVSMLEFWLSERVKELTGGKQTPTTTKPQTVPDFPLAIPVK